MEIELSYSDFKDRIISKSLKWQYNDFVNKYDVFSPESNLLYRTSVWKAGYEPEGDSGQAAIDRTDFETNYKPTANRPQPTISSLTQMEDSSSIDAFGRLRTADLFTIFDSNLVETDGSLFFDTELTGGATSTYLPDESSVRLRCTTVNGDKAIRQSKEYFPYQSGKSQKIVISGNMGAIKANVSQRIGLFDDDNGLFFEQDGTDLKVVKRSHVTGSPVDTAIIQDDWNIDKFDGTGVSGINLDTSKVQIFVIDFQWLGAGRVRMGFAIGGNVYYCHQFTAANNLSTIYMTRASLPVRFEIENTNTTASDTDLKAICASVQSEGGYNPLGVIRSADNGTTTRTVSSTLLPVLSIRLKSGNVRGTIIPLSCGVWVTNNSDINWKIILNGSLTGDSFTSLSSTSITEYDVSASAISGGEVIASGYTGNSIPYLVPLESALRVVSNIAGDSDILTFAAIRISADATTLAQISFKEVF